MHCVVSYTTALIIFAKNDTLFFLTNLFEDICIPQAVYDELIIKDDLVRYRIKTFYALKIEKFKEEDLAKRMSEFKLDKGETAAILLASERDALLIIDEKKGRRVAQEQGLKIVGILGILIENHRKNFIGTDEVRIYFTLFKEQGLRISVELERYFFEKLNKM